MQASAKRKIKICLFASLLLMTGCASVTPFSSASCPVLPQKPSATQPAPTQPYLQSVEEDMQKWDEQQQDISLMLSNSKKTGLKLNSQ